MIQNSGFRGYFSRSVLLIVILWGMTPISCGDDCLLTPETQVQLVDIVPPAAIADLDVWTQAAGPALNFIVSNVVRTENGFFFEGKNQGTQYEEITGRVELIKEADGWMRVGAAFSYESEYGDFVESIFGPFAGIALDLYEPISSDPFIQYPTNESVQWDSDTVHVSDGSQEYDRYFTFSITYIGDADLVASGLGSVKEFSDVIRYRGDPSVPVTGMRPDLVEAYLAPDYGIIYALFRFFDVENACALIGYGGKNVAFPGGDPEVEVVDYFPMAPGNHWLYEFSKDSEPGEAVDFRFSVVPR
jgi:hypothetical protein